MIDSRPLWIPAICLILVAICYANSLPNPFIQDDKLIVVANENIRQIAPLRAFTEAYWPNQRFGGAYRPLTIFSFSVDYAIWGNWAPGFRLTNLVLHALNGWLVFLLAQSLLGSATAALAAAAVYVVHPVHTEAVAGIVGRNELLAAGLMFAAWLLFRKGRAGWSAAVFFLSLMAKENAIIFPAIAILDIALLSGGGFRKVFESRRRFAMLGLAAAAYIAVRFSVLGELGVPANSQYMYGHLSSLQLWMTSGRVFLQYFRLILAPVDVAGLYEFNSIHVASPGDWDAWLGLIVVAAAILCAVLLSKARPAVSFAILFFFVALLPVSNWIVPIGVLLGERFLYTPSFGAALLAGILWTRLPSGQVRQLAGVGFLGIATLLCMSHNLIWRNDFAFYANMVRVLPENVSGRLGYGLALQGKGRFDEAKAQFEAGLQNAPDSPALLASLASLTILTDPRKCNDVQPMLQHALKGEPNHFQSFWVMANCFALDGQLEKADEFYSRADDAAPWPDASLLYDWGLTLEASKKPAAALAVYERAAQISPETPDIQRKVAALRTKMGP